MNTTEALSERLKIFPGLTNAVTSGELAAFVRAVVADMKTGECPAPPAAAEPERPAVDPYPHHYRDDDGDSWRFLNADTCYMRVRATVEWKSSCTDEQYVIDRFGGKRCSAADAGDPPPAPPQVVEPIDRSGTPLTLGCRVHVHAKERVGDPTPDGFDGYLVGRFSDGEHLIASVPLDRYEAQDAGRERLSGWRGWWGASLLEVLPPIPPHPTPVEPTPEAKGETGEPGQPFTLAELNVWSNEQVKAEAKRRFGFYMVAWKPYQVRRRLEEFATDYVAPAQPVPDLAEDAGKTQPTPSGETFNLTSEATIEQVQQFVNRMLSHERAAGRAEALADRDREWTLKLSAAAANASGGASSDTQPTQTPDSSAERFVAAVRASATDKALADHVDPRVADRDRTIAELNARLHEGELVAEAQSARVAELEREVDNRLQASRGNAPFEQGRRSAYSDVLKFVRARGTPATGEGTVDRG